MIVTPLKRKVNYYETDQMSIVHHSNYIKWFEEARLDYLEKIGWGYYEKVMPMGIDMAVLSLHCDYKSMARFGETVLIHSFITESSLSWLNIGYRIEDEKTGVLRATGNTNHCYYDNRKKRPVSLKKAIPELFEIFNELAKEKN